jgi:hypothetical protein
MFIYIVPIVVIFKVCLTTPWKKNFWGKNEKWSQKISENI